MVNMSLIKLAILATIFGCTYAVGIYEQCAGDGYGTFPCDHGLACFRRNRWYSSCQPSCPKYVGWECELYAPTGPTSLISAGWEQCGGDGWVGPRACATGFVCYARTHFYSQCRPLNDCPRDWACAALVTAPTPVTTVPVPAYIPAYSRCSDIPNAVCAPGTACFRQNNGYAECRPYCPPTWACEQDTVGMYGRCGGDGYVGITRCAAGTACFRFNHGFSECRPSCPPTWACENETIALHGRCGGDGYVGTTRCAAGTACFRQNNANAECRTSCPSTWACESETVGLHGRCGGDGYVGITRCAPGLNCYTRSPLHAECAASCPGDGWVC